MKVLMVFVMLVSMVYGQGARGLDGTDGFKDKVNFYGICVVEEVLEGGFIVKSVNVGRKGGKFVPIKMRENLAKTVYLSKHPKWRSKKVKVGTMLLMYVKKAGYYRADDGVSKRYLKYIPVRVMAYSKIKNSRDKRAF